MSAQINLTMIGMDWRPTQKSPRQMLTEWIAFRKQTVERRSRPRLAKVLDCLHVLEGRQLTRLEAIKIERELKGLRDDQKKLEQILGRPTALRRLMVRETEPVTVEVRTKGWVRVRIGRGGKLRDETLEIRGLNNTMTVRGRKGKAADLGFKPNKVTRVL